jgi:hypothetical protein
LRPVSSTEPIALTAIAAASSVKVTKPNLRGKGVRVTKGKLGDDGWANGRLG